MGKGPGLYSDIGKRARGYWFLHLHLHFWVIWCSICHFCWFFLQILLCFAFFFGRSSLQRLPERPEVHHHHLLPHWSCEFVLPHFLQFLDLFLCRRYTCGCNFHWWMNLEERKREEKTKNENKLLNILSWLLYAVLWIEIIIFVSVCNRFWTYYQNLLQPSLIYIIWAGFRFFEVMNIGFSFIWMIIDKCACITTLFLGHHWFLFILIIFV